MALTEKMSVANLLRLRRLPRKQALEFVARFGLDPEEMAQAERLMIADVEKIDKHYDARLWVATAFILGASLRQIALDKGVSRQSVFNQLDRMLPIDRTKKRLSPTLSLEALSAYKVAFLESIERFRHMSPEETAIALMSEVDTDTDD